MSAVTVDAPRLLVAGTASGVGKTTFTAGLCRALSRRGLSVATFKCGPDYLDPSYHALASGRACHNLDGYMMGEQGVRRTFGRMARGTDLALIEGMMGLFDGASATSIEGSSAEIARWLDAPVILVCDGSAMARSLGALVHGFASFEPGVRVEGVVCNGVSSKGHRALLEAASPRPVLGALARDERHALPERHLGLWHASEVDPEWLEACADRIEAQCDVDALIALARSAPPLVQCDEPRTSASARCRIGVARDEAFCFYYDESLRALERSGAELAFFSPLRDARLPEVDGIYLGGGYPELHAARLSSNREMSHALRAHAAMGRPIYAECGGLMYLCEAIETVTGERHAMLGLVPGTARVERTLQAIGYVEVELTRDSWIGPAGTRARGHQFRYSQLVGAEPARLYSLRTPASGGAVVGTEGYAAGSVLGSYVHLCLSSAPALVEGLVRACAAARERVT